MTGRAFVLVLIAASTLFAARNVGIGWLYALGYSLAAGIMASALAGAFALRGVRVSLVPGRKTEAGLPLVVAVTLENRGRRPRRYLSVLAGPVGFGGRLRPWRRALVPDGWGSVLIPELKPGERLTVQLPIPAPRRGIHEVPPIHVQSAPLGLVAWFKRCSSGVGGRPGRLGDVMVHPRVHPLDGLPWLSFRRGHGDESASARPRDGGDLIKTVRPYRTGDAMRQIHWKTTARTGQLVVRETEGEDDPQGLAVVLDASADHSHETFDHAIEITASILSQAHRLGLEARLFSQAGKPEYQTLGAQLDWLAMLKLSSVKEPGSSTPPLWSPPSEPLAAGARGTDFTVVVSPREQGWSGWADVTIHTPPEKDPWPSRNGAIVCPPGSDIARALRGEP